MRFLVLAFLIFPVWAPAGGLRPMSSAEACGQCHRTIVDSWKESAHSKSMESRLFQDSWAAAETEAGSEVRKTCLGCHAPLAVAAGDLQLERKVSWEGVTCDYCHSVREVNLEGGVPLAKLSFGLVKSGPLRQAASGAHLTAYSPVHESSRVCAPCHEYRNAQGFPVLSTFSEWQASRFSKEGKNCQTCHMYHVMGKVADVRISREPDSRINLHSMPGSHSIQQLNKTVKTRLSAIREGGRARITVEVSNTASGHYVPTGSPLRQLILEVKASGSGIGFQDRRIYARTIADASGKTLTKEHAAFLKAANTVSDTRLAPDETRKEEFWFDLPTGVAAEVTATLSYFYSPTTRTERDRQATFASFRTRVR